MRDNLRSRAAAVRRLARSSDLPRRLASLRALAGEVTATSAAATPLTGPIGAGRQLSVVRQPLPALTAAAHQHGVTVNDLLLAAVTTGLRNLLRNRDRCPDELLLRASVPVGARAGDAGGMIVVPLPVGVGDPAERLRLISTDTRRRKRHPDEGIAGMVSMPAALAHLGVAWARRNAATHIHLYVTNVPGPTTPLYLAGARLITAVPVAPLVANVRLSVTALSYDGDLAVALLADESIDDFAGLPDGVRRGFEEYGVRPAERG